MDIDRAQTALPVSERGAQWLNTAGIQARIIVRLCLTLDSPTHVGSGDARGLIDMALMRDPADGRPMISGATLAGALRAYLAAQNPDAASNLFGSVSSDNKSRESWVQVGDAHLRKTGIPPHIAIRDGVGIDSVTRTASPRLKYDLELLEAGASFLVDLALLLPVDHPEYEEHLLRALKGLDGSIRLGKRKRRGYGQCRIAWGKVWRYTFPKDLVRWLENPLSEAEGEWTPLDLSQFKAQAGGPQDCTITLTCTLASSLLVRAAPVEIDAGTKNMPDQEMMRSRRTVVDNGKEIIQTYLVLPGTSLAGALRARTERIANTLHPGEGKIWAARLFGESRQADKPTASRIWVDETEIQGANEWVHTRVKIDRFTGGAYPGALFSEGILQPSPETKLTIRLRLQDAGRDEVGMLLLLLKDLWTGDLPIGGEAGVGRGRLEGQKAVIQWKGEEWVLTHKGSCGLHVDAPPNAEDLNQLVRALGGKS